MVKITEFCTVETLLTSDKSNKTNVKFEINVKKFPNQKILLGMQIGERFRKCDIAKFCRDKETEYEIINIRPHLTEKEILRIRRNEQVNKLISILNTYNFEGFIHTTEIDNFKSILENGYLYPRNYLTNRNFKFKDAAEITVLEKTEDYVKNCCRFYYYFKTPTNYTAKYINPVIIVFDKKLAYYSNVFFTPENAQRGKRTSDVKEALTFDWEGIFERGGYSHSKYCHGELTEEITKKISRIRNAEFLVHGKVPINYIYKIYISSQEHVDLLKAFCNEEIMKKVEIGRDKFD